MTSSFDVIPDVPDRNNGRLWPPRLALATLAIITLAFYYGLWWPGLALVKRDAARFFIPMKQHLVERFSAGELPQWFPYEALGRPFIAATHTGVFHPFNLLYFLFDAPDGYRASILLSCLLAGLGAFALGRLLHFTAAGAMLAGISFALSGYVASLTENIQYLYSICVLPLFCAGLEKSLRAGCEWAIFPAVIWATVFLNGDVQTGYYYLFIALAWMMARTPLSFYESGLRLALLSGLALLLASLQLGPSWSAYVGSERTHLEIFLNQAQWWSTNPLRLLTVIAGPVGEQVSPTLMASIFFKNDLPPGFLADSLYLGVPVTGLALIGSWYRRDLRILVLLGSVALALALGRFGSLYDLFYKTVPLWSAFRYPEKLMGVVSFTAAMLAGAGLDILWTRKVSPAPWLAMAILCATAGLALHTEAAAAWMATSFGAPDVLVHEVAVSAGIALLYSAATALVVWLVTVSIRENFLQGTIALLLLLTVITLDLARANLGAYYTGPVEAVTFTPPFVEAVKTQEGILAPGRFRLFSLFEPVQTIPLELMPSQGHYRSALYTGGSVERRYALDVEHNAEFRLESISPYMAGYSSQFAEAMNKRMGFASAARLNVSYYIGRRYHLREPRLVQAIVAELPPYDLVLFRNPVSPKPRVYLSRKPERADNPVEPAALFARPDYLNGDVDVIETPDGTLPGPASDGRARIEAYAPEQVRVRVETPHPAVLILLDSFDNGWTATLDNGVAVPLRRANALVRAVVVPAGTHLITFAYQTPLLKAGAWASLTGVVVCLGLVAQARWLPRRRRQGP